MIAGQMDKFENVLCSECKRLVIQSKGFLTFEQKERFRCEDCSQPVLENRVASQFSRQGKKNRQLLID
jgi:DNA-directed RNA polymerase subunit RPC12/RpoP